MTFREAEVTIVSYWVFSAAVGGLEEPDASSSKSYRWFFRFIHILAGNLATFAASKFPAGTMVAQKTETIAMTPPEKTS